MKNLGLMVFRLGSPAAEPIAQEAEKFYLWVAEQFTGETHANTPLEGRTTIPIDGLTLEDQPEVILSMFQVTIEGWSALPDTVVVHVEDPAHGIVRGSLSFCLCLAISRLLESRAESPTFIILLSTLPPEGDVVRQAISPFIERQKATIVGDDGQVLAGSAGQLKTSTEQGYPLQLAKVRKDPLRLLELKMIRRLGHFQTQDAGKATCRRYYYDCSLCGAELSSLLCDEIERIKDGTRPAVILYDSPISPWLETALRPIEVKLDVATISVDDFLNPTAGFSVVDNESAVLVLPMVDSGNRLKVVLHRLQEKRPKLRLYLLSVLTTRTDDVMHKVRKLRSGSATHDICYLLKVDQVVFRNGACPMCLLEIPTTQFPDRESYIMLTAYDMWDMAESAGWRAKEKDKPPWRGSMGSVPNFARMVEQNRAWVATKIRMALERTLSELPVDPVVICPKGEEGSRALSECLQSTLDFTVINIPRDVINLFRNGGRRKIPWEKWEKDSPRWYVQLASLSSDQVIVMDEFNVSGNTRASLKRLITERPFKKQVLCYFSICDFNPSASSQGDVSTGSLYEFQAYEHP